ncbi:MAG TPA: arsenic resistance N-acetyltransferase ArsN2 [Gemmatimonadaceae bacterium]|nr:arsenic resistance N-acetyltransferase ArsN2 [Gemmatimonadaceae bacterium]
MKDFWIRRAKAEDLESVCKLLETSHLPVEGVTESFDNFILAEGNGIHVVGAAGLEIYGRVALLRSVVVASGWQGYGVGRALTGEILSRARERGITDVYLLTTTAEQFFPSFGFVKVDRPVVPEELQQSPELRGACPSSATVMRLSLLSGPT